MANKISIGKGDVNDFYEPSGSEEEYTEREKTLLKKVRQRKKQDDSEEEVLPFDDDDDDEADDDDQFGDKFEADSDLDQYDNNAIPDERAWGKKRRDFFATDFVDQDYSSYTAAEEKLAEQEESEARAIQKRLAQQLNEADFTLNVYASHAEEPSSAAAEEPSAKAEQMQKDLSDLSHREKLRLFKKDSPEFDGLVDDFQQRLTESRDRLQPVLDYFNQRKDIGSVRPPLLEFVQLKNDLILNYCSNISFYLVLKSKRIPIKSHPLVKRLVQMRELLLQMEDKYQMVIQPQLEILRKQLELGIEPVFTETAAVVNGPVPAEKKRGKKLAILRQTAVPAVEKESGAANESEEDDKPTEKHANAIMEKSESEADEDVEDEELAEDGGDEDERRKITYQISKNKGLTPHRKKELRNPRVKHRNKFRKALIRRKGAVRTVRKEVKRYSGEMSGIKATTKKGIKIK